MKQRNRKIVIFVLAFIVLSSLISIIAGSEQKERLLVVTENIDITQPMEEQAEKLSFIELNRNEAQSLNQSVVRSMGELEGMWAMVELEPGNPIPTSVLRDEGVTGEFASSVRRNKTYFTVQGGVSQLPPGADVGDRINVGLLYSEDRDTTSINVLIEDVELGEIGEENVYIEVTLEEDYLLTAADEMGSVILQLPGQRNVPLCEDVEEEGVECYSNSERPQKFTQEDVLELLDTEEVYIPDEVDMDEEPEEEPAQENVSEETSETIPRDVDGEE